MIRLRQLLCGLAAFALVAPAGQADEQAQYFAVLLAGKKIGHAQHIRKVADGKVTATEKMVLGISRAGTVIAVRAEDTYVETTGGKPIGFKSVLDAGAMAMNVMGSIGPDGKLTLILGSSPRQTPNTMDWPKGAVLAEGMRLRQKKEGLTEGTSYIVKTFVPSLCQTAEAQIKVGAKKQVDLLGRVARLTEVTTVLKLPTGKTTSTGYVDDQGQVQKTLVPMLGMTLEVVSCSRQFALSNDDVVDFLDKLLVASPVPLKHAATAKAITYHLRPTGKEPLKIAATDYQTVRPAADGTLIVTVRPVRGIAGGNFPYAGNDAAARKALRPTRYLQSDSEKIMAAAREAIGDTTDAAEAVERIQRYVRKHITKKDLSVGYAAALEVLESKQGDCSEHAVLAAAMCRSIGIPARVVSGVTYVERVGARKHVFGPHAWVEALVGGKWVGLDAAMNGHDAGHIAICSGDGGPEDFLDGLSTLGCFEIVKVTVQK